MTISPITRVYLIESADGKVQDDTVYLSHSSEERLLERASQGGPPPSQLTVTETV